MTNPDLIPVLRSPQDPSAPGRREGAVSAEVRRFFADNPDEELTLTDMQTKWDLTYHQVQDIVKRLRKEGLVESVHVVRNRAKGIACP